MAHEGGGVFNYRGYADEILPRIKEAGYNVVQLMAIQEHAYYASFGYHVTGFFAVSSRQGTPEDFKYLVDKAHSLGIKVIIDIIHSHASSNVNDGLNRLDGTDACYSHAGPRGYHQAWDSMVFDYGKYEVKRFLLSNLAWFLDEYKVDGFRFDAVTSILYHHHGIGHSFAGGYPEYFGLQTDLDGIIYLMLANTLIRRIRSHSISIAEDVSGFPTLCRTLIDGGIGFDYRLGMFLPDMWIKLLKETPDEQWSMSTIAHAMINRRWKEKVLAYSESHDQAIVGDKTTSQWLFEDEAYRLYKSNNSLKVNRGVALHKMIRLITFSLGGQAYLNFMGNEFGHPEWIDFPREGNNWSYHWCRRQWSLKYNKDLYYNDLGEFDKVMNDMETKFNVMMHDHEYVSLQDDDDKMIVFERGELVYIFNFHSSNSYENFLIGTQWSSPHMILFETDQKEFGGL
jgi:1,4-alpha-glucan branching enzyme